MAAATVEVRRGRSLPHVPDRAHEVFEPYLALVSLEAHRLELHDAGLGLAVADDERPRRA